MKDHLLVPQGVLQVGIGVTNFLWSNLLRFDDGQDIFSVDFWAAKIVRLEKLNTHENKIKTPL